MDRSLALMGRREGGFTFLEVMVALAIVASLLTTLALTTSHNLDVAGMHEALTVSTLLARDKMTDVVHDPKTALKEKKGQFPEPFEDFSFVVEVRDRDMAELYQGLMVTEIVVTVTGRGEEVSLRKIVQQGKAGS